jgi:hypothetical protein
MSHKAVFVLRFMSVFALLIVLGWATSAPKGYAFVLERVGAVAGPAAHGWWLERAPGHPRTQLWFRRDTQRLPLLLNLETLALGLLPMLSLISATPGLGFRRWLSSAAVGCLAFFCLHLMVLVLYPVLVSSPNAVTDITGTFLGLLSFVGAPVILWFALTFDRLRDVWKLR